MGKLTQATIRSAISKAGRYRDGDGLMLLVTKPGQASWVCRIQQDGKRRDYGLGSLKLYGLAEARERSRTVKRELLEGRDPHALRKPPPGLTRLFRDVADEFVTAKLSAGSQKLALARLTSYAFPQLGKLQIQTIDADVIARSLRPIWQTKPETAKRVRQLIIRVIRYARPDGALLETTLAKGVSDRLPAQPRRGNFAAMDYRDLPAFMSRLERKSGLGALALRGVILTAARSGEIRGATWDELDLDRATWTIPADRMKMRRAHRVPLSREAVEVFKQAAALRRRGSDLVFPNSKGTVLSDMTLTKCLRDMGEGATAHGMRSSFRDWAAEQSTLPGEVAEAALAHSVPSAVEAAYRRTDFFALRRELMDAWGRFAGGSEAEVVQIASRLSKAC